ncbi:MAG: methylmalonyl-CoA mutase family protein [Deltaproteobacteria bacterium]|nr:methylmalonyl-CoA mutase family protein [Deltaproteobacteria bacterium]
MTINKQKWEKEILDPFIKKTPERQNEFTTVSNRPINRVYTADDLAGFSAEADLGLPGDFPFTRGVYPTMHRGRLWTMRQFAGFGTARDTNARFKYLLKNGQTGLSTAFHFPTLMGYDSDDPRSRGEVGVCGVAIDSLKDMEQLFDGIPLEDVTVSMTINGPAAILLAYFVATAEKQGCNLNKVGGTTQNDILKEYIAQNSYIIPPEPGIKLVVDTIEYCAKHLPKWNPVSISGYHIREAGSTAVQELAFTIYDGLEYVKYSVARGLSVDSFAPRLSFFFNAHQDFFEELAKYRAARRIWAREMRRRFNPQNPNSMRCRFHVQTAGCSLTAQQPENNIIRTTLQALSAVLGGCQSLHTNSMDETLALPSEKAVQIALRTQQVIAHEAGVVNTIDPVAGSYFLESLTNKMEEEAMAIIKKLDDMGGMVAAIKNGYPMMAIAEASRVYQRQVETKEKIIIGVNDYIAKDETPLEILKISHEVEQNQVRDLQRLRRERDQTGVREALDALTTVIKGQGNVMPPLVACAHTYATIGEIAAVLRKEYGEYRDPGIF